MSPVSKRTAALAVKILIVDDHPVVRQGLSQFIDRTPGLKVCGEAGDARAALEMIAQTGPDVVIADLSLEGMSGLDLIEEMKARHPKLPILVLSMHDETLYAERALRAGARGYVMKDKPIDEVLTAIRRVLKGEIHLSERMSGRLLQKMVGSAPDATGSLVGVLTNRELQIFELIGQGFGTRNIAAKLHLSVKTIDTHRENIKRKLNLGDSVELHQHAFLWAHRTAKGDDKAR
jgi:DNA-binding NarL/FixJ family response regulator